MGIADYLALDYGQPVNRKAPLNRGLVGWWQSLPNTRGGNQLLDLCHRNNGTLTNTPTWSGLSHPGGLGSLKFTGTSSVSISKAVMQFPAANNFTFEFWANLSALAGNPSVFGRNNDDAGAPLVFYDNGNGGWALYLQGNGRENVAGPITANTWNHVVISKTANAVRSHISVNGVLKTSLLNQSDNFTLATQNQSLGNGLAVLGGYVSTLRIYNFGVPDSIAADLYQASRTGYKRELNYLRGRAAVKAAAVSGNRRRRIIIGAGN